MSGLNPLPRELTAPSAGGSIKVAPARRKTDLGTEQVPFVQLKIQVMGQSIKWLKRLREKPTHTLVTGLCAHSTWSRRLRKPVPLTPTWASSARSCPGARGFERKDSTSIASQGGPLLLF